MSYERASEYMEIASECKEKVLSAFHKLNMEYLKLLDEFEQMKERIIEMEMKYENTGAVFNRQYMREKIERYEKALREMIDANDLADWLSQNEWATEADYFITKAREALEEKE